MRYGSTWKSRYLPVTDEVGRVLSHLGSLYADPGKQAVFAADIRRYLAQ